MKRFDQQWQQLSALARQAGENRDCTAPYGFATRIAAQLPKTPLSPWSLLERFALRGLMVASACTVAAAVFTYSNQSVETVDDYTGTETVVALLGLS